MLGREVSTMGKPRIVFIGAGSMSFGASMLRDVFTHPGAIGASFALVDLDEPNLERIFRLAERMNAVTGHGVKLERTTDRRAALPGADFVVTSIAVERCELWRQDFAVPRKYGIRHTLGENGGPGALFFTLRTIPLIMDIVRDMEALCPGALLLNFSNPETRIVLAVHRYSRIRCIGLCHGIFMARDAVARIMGRPPQSVQVLGAGMNHFQWLLDVRDLATGADLYPELRATERAFDPTFHPYTRKLFAAFGLWPTCSDDHLGEYQAYGYEAGEHGYDFDADARGRVEMAEEIRRLTAGEKDMKPFLAPSGEKAMEVIAAMSANRRTLIDSAIVPNHGTITSLPADVAVEVPVVVDGSGVHPVHIGNMPLGITNLMNMQVGPQQLSVEAAVRGSKELAFQALLCDPVTNSIEAGRRTLDELWELNVKYIRACI
jgi:alpha-galactosidase